MAAENRGPELAAVVILLLVFAILTVGLRCFTRKVLLNVFFVEDWLAVVTLVSQDAFESESSIVSCLLTMTPVDNLFYLFSCLSAIYRIRPRPACRCCPSSKTTSRAALEVARPTSLCRYFRPGQVPSWTFSLAHLLAKAVAANHYLDYARYRRHL